MARVFFCLQNCPIMASDIKDTLSISFKQKHLEKQALFSTIFNKFALLIYIYFVNTQTMILTKEM